MMPSHYDAQGSIYSSTPLDMPLSTINDIAQSAIPVMFLKTLKTTSPSSLSPTPFIQTEQHAFSEPFDDRSKFRKESHKHVERRRREAINDGIIKIQVMIPDGERSKCSVLQRAATYIQHLKQQELLLTDKLVAEKSVADAQIRALQEHYVSLRHENSRLNEELRLYRNNIALDK